MSNDRYDFEDRIHREYTPTGIDALVIEGNTYTGSYSEKLLWNKEINKRLFCASLSGSLLTGILIT